MEHKYIVIKIDDAKRHLTPEEFDTLQSLLQQIQYGREHVDGKVPYNYYYVVNVDAPYSEEVCQLIENNIEKEI